MVGLGKAEWVPASGYYRVTHWKQVEDAEPEILSLAEIWLQTADVTEVRLAAPTNYGRDFTMGAFNAKGELLRSASIHTRPDDE